MRAFRTFLSIVAAIGFAAPALSETARMPKKSDPNEIVCEKITAIGSRVATKRVCATRAEWAEQRKLDREAIEQAQRMGNGPCQTTGSNPGGVNAATARPSC